MSDPKSRAKLLRILRGDFRQGDLTDLFLFARDHCDGRETVKEVGDFAAHHNQRDRGIVTRGTRDWFTVVRFHMPTFGNNGQRAFDGQRMPPATRDYFKVAVNRLDPKAITESIRLRKVDAQKISLSIANRLVSNADGTWALPRDLTSTEIALTEYLCSVIVVKPAFEDAWLAEEFLATLKSNSLITKEEISQHGDKLGALIKLYAIALMHNCNVQLGDGSTTQLKAMIHNGATDRISVSASVPNAIPSMPRVNFASDIFAANVACAEHCHPQLLEKKEWDFELEVAPDGKLAPLS